MDAAGFAKLYTKEWPNAFAVIDAPLSEHTTFRVGGPADVLVAPSDEEQLFHALALCRKFDYPYTVIGAGSNLIVRDGGVRGAVIKLGSSFNSIFFSEGKEIRAMAGARLMSLARESIDRGLSGLAFASGIPGSVGGAVYMNAGAYGGEIKNIITSVSILNIDTLSKERIFVSQKDFGYRSSIFQHMNCVVLDAVFSLEQCFDSSERLRADEYLKRRREKQPINIPSAGSVFKRPEGHFAGALIEEAGLKGVSIGGAQVSPKHAGFIVNTGGAAAKDILLLIETVRNAVFKHSGIMLEPEIRIIGEE